MNDGRGHGDRVEDDGDGVSKSQIQIMYTYYIFIE